MANASIPAMSALLSDASGHRSRENLTTADTTMVPGAVMETRDAGVTWGPITNVDLTDTTVLAVLLGPSTTGDVAVVRRDCEVINANLSWPSAVTSPRRAAALVRLATQGVIAR